MAVRDGNSRRFTLYIHQYQPSESLATLAGQAQPVPLASDATASVADERGSISGNRLGIREKDLFLAHFHVLQVRLGNNFCRTCAEVQL